jgi:hypothetical protein
MLKKTQCKGGKPSLLPIRTDPKTAPPPGSRPPEPERNLDAGPKLYREFMDQQHTASVKKVHEDAQKRRIVELASHDFEVTDETGTEKPTAQASQSGGILRPKFTITHIQDQDMGEFIANGIGEEYRWPKELLIKIELPKVVSSE